MAGTHPYATIQTNTCLLRCQSGEQGRRRARYGTMTEPRLQDDHLIVAESYSRIGELNAGHRRKIAMDALKLLSLKHTLADKRRVRYLIVVPDELSKRLSNLEGWFPTALDIAAEVVSVALLPSERKKLVGASARQAQGQARMKRSRKAFRE